MLKPNITPMHITTAVLTFFSRFQVLPANFSALGSFGFFSKNPTLFIISILLFDFVKGGFYKGFIMTYLGFAVYYLLGRVAAENKTKQIALLPLASLLFFVFSNLGVWWFWFPQTAEGLIACFTAALPFYKNTFLSDIFFGYGYIAVRHLVEKYELRTVSQPSPIVR